MSTAAGGPAVTAVRRVAANIEGRAIAPGDADYDAVRRVFPGHIDRRPALIVRPASARDVQRVVRVARETGADLAVRSGGHSHMGTTDGGVVIDLRDLSLIDVDARRRTMWAGAGLTAAAVTKAAGEHGLAIGFGDTGSVGIGGITLGGGVGYLVRKHGLTIDSLLAAEIVTADGEARVVDADHEPDLFWAIRGGGGNFGIVTRFQYRLQELPQAYGGFLILPATPDTITGFLDAAEAAADELSTIANVMPAPPFPFVAAEHHGTVVIFAIVCYAGPAEAGEHALAPFRALATPLGDMVRPISYPEIYPPDDESYRPKAAALTLFTDHVDRAVAELVLARLNASDAAVRAVQLRVLGGAMARVPADATAFAHRDARIMGNVAAFWEGADRPAREAWVAELTDGLRGPDRRAYVNFLGDEGEARIRDAYPGATYRRLSEIKRRYDPGNLFRRNQNIRPA